MVAVGVGPDRDDVQIRTGIGGRPEEPGVDPEGDEHDRRPVLDATVAGSPPPASRAAGSERIDAVEGREADSRTRRASPSRSGSPTDT